MESDLVLEVPDTPERLAHLSNESSRKTSENENVRHFLVGNSPHLILDGTGDWDVSTKRGLDDVKLPTSQGKLSQLMPESLDRQPSLISTFEVGQRGISSVSKDQVEKIGLNSSTLNIQNGTIGKDVKRKRGKRLRGENSKFLSPRSKDLLGIGSSLPALSTGHSHSQSGIIISDNSNGVLLDNPHADLKSMEKGKGVDFSSGLHSESPQELANAEPTDIPQRSRKLRRLVRNGCISPYNIARTCDTSGIQYQNRITSDGQKYSSFARSGDQDILNGIDNMEELQHKNTQRKLERNECISQNNNSESSTARQPIGDVKQVMTFRRVPKPNGTSHQVHNISPDSRGRYEYGKNGKGKGKGKEIADTYLTVNKEYGLTIPLSRESEEDVAIYGDSSCGILGSEDVGRGARDRAGKEPTVSEAVNIYKIEEASDHHSDHSNQVARETGYESRTKRHTEGKGKYSSSSNSRAESSNSVPDVIEISNLRTSQQPSRTRSTRTRNPRQHGTFLGPVIEVDELLSPEPRSSDLQEQNHNVFDSCNARAIQVESDELLAQQLQEQFYNELGIETGEEIDAAIALSLQQEENVWLASLASRRTPRTHRERLMARLHSQQPPRRNYSSRAVNSARHGSSSRAARLRGDIDFPEMDIDMRVLLEEVRAGIHNVNRGVSRNYLHIQRDFNENDYETLLALDDNNHQHTGASEIQISNLPQSVVQTDNAEEPCAVCLEKPSTGDVIRHLPCLHKFHKDCIDEWLRRKTACPICKNGIT